MAPGLRANSPLPPPGKPRPGQGGSVLQFWNGWAAQVVAGFSRPLDRLVGFWVVVVSVRGPGVWGVSARNWRLETSRG